MAYQEVGVGGAIWGYGMPPPENTLSHDKHPLHKNVMAQIWKIWPKKWNFSWNFLANSWDFHKSDVRIFYIFQIFYFNKNFFNCLTGWGCWRRGRWGSRRGRSASRKRRSHLHRNSRTRNREVRKSEYLYLIKLKHIFGESTINKIQTNLFSI